MTLRKVLPILLAVAAGCAQSPTGDDGFDPASIATSKDEGIICHNQVETGSRIKTNRVCTTREEREQMALDVREAKQAMHRSRSLAPEPPAESAP